jgi:uncharacterized coiled-coil protein SlyX
VLSIEQQLDLTAREQELQLQDKMIDELDKKTDKAQDKMDKVNDRMKDALAKMNDKSTNMCLYG